MGLGYINKCSNQAKKLKDLKGYSIIPSHITMTSCGRKKAERNQTNKQKQKQNKTKQNKTKQNKNKHFNPGISFAVDSDFCVC